MNKEIKIRTKEWNFILKAVMLFSSESSKTKSLMWFAPVWMKDFVDDEVECELSEPSSVPW